jgi:opacity protein-like surface antigen
MVILATLTLAPAAAQQAPARDGFFFGVGFGYGGLELTCEGCDFDREGSYSGHIRLGGALNQRLLLGVESEGFYKDEATGWLTAGTITGSVYYYPLQHTPLYVRGGVGLGLLQIEVDGIGGDTQTGFGWSVGLGYDIPVGETTALTPYANWMWGDLEEGGFNIYQIGLALSIY